MRCLEGEELPGSRDALEFVYAKVPELKPGANREIPHCTRHDHFTSTGLAHHPSSEMDRDARDAFTAQLDLPGVDARPHLKAEFSQLRPDRSGTPDRTRRTVECGQHPISCPVDELAAVVGHGSS